MDNNWIAKRAQALFSMTVGYRRTLHQNPELSFQEFKTSAFIARKLSQIPGMKVETGLGLETNVLGTISGNDGPVIAMRSDIDALPIQEVNECSYKSRTANVMHACGHDAHMAIALTVAQIIGEIRNNGHLNGTVKFIFQPAEETTDETGQTGAQYLVKSGLLKGIDALFALHVMPENNVGQVLTPFGNCTANVDEFSAIIKGKGGHGAYPHLGKDPIWMVGVILQAIQGIVAREVSPLEAAVISVCHVSAGDSRTSNIIPNEALIKGTFRSYSPQVRNFMIKEFEKVLSMTCSLGGDYTLSINRGEPSVHNDTELITLIRSCISDLPLDIDALPDKFGLGGEDFAHMAGKVRAAMFFLGCSDRQVKEKKKLHSPFFDIDERCLPIGVMVFVSSILKSLQSFA